MSSFNQEKALVGAFSVFVQPVVEPMARFTALILLVQRFQFPASSTPALPPYLGHYPALTPEQLGYLRLLNQGLNINPALGQLGQGAALGQLGHGAALGQLGQGALGQLGQLGGQLRQGPQFTTIVNSQIKTTSVTLTESEEYRWA